MPGRNRLFSGISGHRRAQLRRAEPGFYPPAYNFRNEYPITWGYSTEGYQRWNNARAFNLSRSPAPHYVTCLSRWKPTQTCHITRTAWDFFEPLDERFPVKGKAGVNLLRAQDCREIKVRPCAPTFDLVSSNELKLGSREPMIQRARGAAAT